MIHRFIKTKNLYFILLILVCHSINGQNEIITGDFFKDISSILKESSIKVAIMDSVSTSPRFEELDARFERVWLESPEWLDDYLEQNEDEQDYAYDQRFGLTEKEFNEWLKLDNERFITSSVSRKLNIIRDEKSGIISFTGHEDLDILSHLKINLISKKIYFKNIEFNSLDNIFFSKNDEQIKYYHSDGIGYSWDLIDSELQHQIWRQKKFEYLQVYFSLYYLPQLDEIEIHITEIFYDENGFIHGNNTNLTDLYIRF